MPSLIDRYDLGEKVEVWNEIHELGSLSLLDAASAADVHSVAHRTMGRAATNVATLYERLRSLDFAFEDPQVVYVPITTSRVSPTRRLRESVGEIPASLEAWLELVGDVTFRGHLPALGTLDEWQGQYLDPLEFCCSEDSVSDDLKFHADWREREEKLFPFTFAGDYLHKNNTSGGAGTCIYLPADEGDARVIEDDGSPESRPIWFVDYLRMYFQGGGFRRIAQTKSYPAKLLAHLSHGLLEI